MTTAKWQQISATEFHQNWQDWQLVDIRDLNSFNQGHIPGSINLTNENLQSYIDESDLDKPLAVICYVGNSSKGAAEFLSKAGFNDVYSLDGGLSLWRTLYPDLLDYS